MTATPLHLLIVEAWVGCMHSDEWKERLGGFVPKERKS